MKLSFNIGVISLFLSCFLGVSTWNFAHAFAQTLTQTFTQTPIVEIEPIPKLPKILVLPNGIQPINTPDLSDAVGKGAESYLRHQDRNIVDFLSFRTFQNQLLEYSIYKERLNLAKGFVELGIDLFQKMDVKGSTENLEKGLAQFRELGYAFIAPKEVSNALIYLALSTLDDHGDIGTTLEIFKEMILIDPEIDLKEGLYPENAISYFRSARLELEKKTRIDPQSRPIVSIAFELSDADYIATYSIISGTQVSNSKHLIVLDVFDRANDRFFDRVKLPLIDLEKTTIEDAANQLMSQFITCLEEPTELPERIKKSKGKSPWSLELGFAYLSFFKFPGPTDLGPFGNAGGAIGLSYNLTEEFALQISAHVTSSFRDRNGALLDTFQTMRAFVGGDIGMNLGDFRLSVGTFLEGTFLPNVQICNTVDYRARSGQCNNRVKNENFGSFIGVNLRPRAHYRVNDSLSVFIGASSSFYLFPITKNTVNFPNTGEMGLKYRF